jgi:hypothetical protein
MQKTSSIAKKLASDAITHPHLSRLTLMEGETFSWDHTACAITFIANAPHADAYLLHEYAHALLAHQTYRSDLELIRMERAAWEKAKELSEAYGVAIDENLVENSLDTYRDWLHARSLCPKCGATGVQMAPREYRCIACDNEWRVNEARTCALRRHTIKKHPR